MLLPPPFPPLNPPPVLVVLRLRMPAVAAAEPLGPTVIGRDPPAPADEAWDWEELLAMAGWRDRERFCGVRERE